MSKIEHEGRVVSVADGLVRVEVEAGEACGACAARKQCAMGHASDHKIIDVATADASLYKTGERVMVASQGRVGAMAVALGYLSPLVVLIAVLICCIGAGVSEQTSAIVAIVAVAVYYAVLYVLRRAIAKKVNFTISKTE